MPDPQDKHHLAKIALRRKTDADGASGKGGDAPGAADEAVEDQFDKAFAETFGAPPSPQAAPPPFPAAPPRPVAPPAPGSPVVPTRTMRESLSDIHVDVGEPVAEGSGAVEEATRDGFLRALAADTGVPAVDLDRVTFDLALLDLLPRDVAVRNLLLPLALRDQQLLVALADPRQRRAIDELEFVSGYHVVPHVAPHSQLRRFIDACYRARAAGERTYGMPGAASPGQFDSAVVPAIRPGDASADDSLARMPVTAQPIDLDDHPTPTPLPAAGLPAPDERRQKRVLVVDDEADIRMLIVRVLRDRGYEVLEATQGAEALRVVQAAVPDLLILDAMLPEIHGFDVCRRIKQSSRYRHIPVIMISAIYRGWRFASDLRKSYGVDWFVEKPFKIGELVERVAQLLSGRDQPPAAVRELSLQAQAELAAGVRKYREGDIVGAIEHLRRGIEADPLSQQLHYQLGILYGKQGQIYQAIQELEAALEIEPGDFATLRGLGQLYEHAGFPCKAVEMWERAASASDDEAARSSIKEHLLKLL